MTRISITSIPQPTCSQNAILKWFTTSISDLARGFTVRRCLLAELERLPDATLQDIGFLQSDVELIRKAPLLGNCSRQLAARLSERRTMYDFQKPVK